MAGLDVSVLQGIDVHVHVESDGHGQLSLDDELLAASAKYFKADNDRAPTVEQIADYYRQRNLAAVVFTVDAGTATGHPALSSEEVADRAAAHPDVLIPFGSVDPLTGEAAVRRAQHLISEHAVRGFKFHPSLQGFQSRNSETVTTPRTAAAYPAAGGICAFCGFRSRAGAGWLPGQRSVVPVLTGTTDHPPCSGRALPASRSTPPAGATRRHPWRRRCQV
jgi:predicted TIM-barrel fold metal-dependent hydrolase